MTYAIPFGQLRSNPVPRDGESVTLSDCGKALDEIERELESLKRQEKETLRRMEALQTQAKMIRMIARQLSGF